MRGKLFGVGIGPGDPELITIKAMRILEKAKNIAVPKSNKEKGSVALSIVNNCLTHDFNLLELVFPMTDDKNILLNSWEKAAFDIAEKLDLGEDVSFITLGDPSIYSTYMYIHKKLVKKGYEAEIVPGITSFCASAANAGISLCENSETLAIIPSSYECEKLDMILDTFDNIVMMKAAKSLQKINNMLKEKGLYDNVVLVSQCGLEGQVIEKDLNKAEKMDLSYFTTLIIKRNGEK